MVLASEVGGRWSEGAGISLAIGQGQDQERTTGHSITLEVGVVKTDGARCWLVAEARSFALSLLERRGGLGVDGPAPISHDVEWEARCLLLVLVWSRLIFVLISIECFQSSSFKKKEVLTARHPTEGSGASFGKIGQNVCALQNKEQNIRGATGMLSGSNTENTRHYVTVDKTHEMMMCAQTKPFDKIEIILTKQCLATNHVHWELRIERLKSGAEQATKPGHH